MTEYIKMKKKILFFIGASLLLSCNSSGEKSKANASTSIDTNANVAYTTYGEKVIDTTVMNISEMTEKYQALENGDTIQVAFSGTVSGVCKMKGCWMTIPLSQEEEVMVKFKNYGFFVPKDIEEDTVVIQGRAFVNEVSVEEQRHYALDAGKSEEEVAEIREPKKTYSFIADGVLIKNNG